MAYNNKFKLNHKMPRTIPATSVLYNVADINTRKCIYDKTNSIFKYNVSDTHLSNIQSITMMTPYMYVDFNDIMLLCFRKGSIPITLLCQHVFIKGVDYRLHDKFNQKMLELEQIISTDEFKLQNFGTTNMTLTRESVNFFGYGTYVFKIPLNELNGVVIRNELHFKKDVLDKFTCPITGTVPLEPVLFDKHIYDRTAIITWLRKSYSSPLTRRSHDDCDKLLEITELSLGELEEFNSYKIQSDYDANDEIIIDEKVEKKHDCNYNISVFLERKDGISTMICTNEKQPEEYLINKMKIKIAFDITIQRNENKYFMVLTILGMLSDTDF
jgi:hypothetical protein